MDIVRSNCEKERHFNRVCRLPSKKDTTSATASLLSIIIATPVPACLYDTLTDVTVSNITLKALIDTKRSESYIAEFVVLSHLKVIKSSKVLYMACMSPISHTTSRYVNIIFENKRQFQNLCIPTLVC